MTTLADVTVDNSDGMLGPEQITAVAEYAEQGVLYRVGTATERGLLPSDEKYPGMMWRDTDAGAFSYVWSGSAWVMRGVVRGVQFGALANVDGLITIAHGLGVTPDWVQVSILYISANDTLSKIADAVIYSKNSTNVVIRMRRTDTSGWFPSDTFAGFITVGIN